MSSTLDDRPEIDEQIPTEYDEDRLTWIDEIGLDKQLDAAAERVRSQLDEGGETHSRERIKLALAAWLHQNLVEQLARAEILLAEGSDYFFSVLRPADEEEETITAPPPPHQAATTPTDATSVF